MMTSSDQMGKLLKKKNVTPNKDPPEGKTTAIVAVMRGRPRIVTTANAVTSTTKEN
jgi:hypothetical protein